MSSKMNEMEWKEIHSFTTDFGDFTCVTISPDGKTLATSTDKGVIILQDLFDFNKILQKSVHSAAINQIVWSNNGKYIVSCSNDKTIKILDSSNLEEIHTYEGQDAIITCCDISLSCDLICGADTDGRIMLWATSSPNSMISKTNHTDAITSIHFYHSLFILTSSLDCIVRIFSTDNLILLKTYVDLNGISNANFTTDRRYITMSTLESITYIYDLKSGEPVGEFTGYVNKDYLISPCLHYDRNTPDGPVTIIFPSEDGKLVLYDFATQKHINTFQIHKGYFKFDISRDGNFIATADIENRKVVIRKREC
ncbi:WD repeat-containing protein 5 [Tritrichomonas foetus]|uniref:WD repeat-containing protein 5 n=1 Tax=Tritrichomonas foetus TaxID=1144522 RepID=A0A1J4JVE9_9EUKA|nr:WD repeat-containing protein 5 [Tritrichomonas foetus]|eukprot:OHT02987.1 WD repeat-containing protein 5 [Tritrichomonas foetus]